MFLSDFLPFSQTNKMLSSSIFRLGLLGAGVSVSAASVGLSSIRAASTLPKVYFDMEADGEPVGRIVMQVK